MADVIKITGARIHNLKSIDTEIPRNKLTVITGVSGSGKSSLAFDILYEEGKRRYLMFSDTSFTVDDHASSFESITGLSPTVAVEQRIIRQSNPRSTVGTRTKISAMLAVLMARYGKRPPEYAEQQLTMAAFQRNSPKGMCIKCLGSGTVKTLDEDALFGDLSQKVDDVVLGVGKRGTTRRTSDFIICLCRGRCRPFPAGRYSGCFWPAILSRKWIPSFLYSTSPPSACMSWKRQSCWKSSGGW